MSGSRWICPHCEHAAIITTGQNTRTGSVATTFDSGDGTWVTQVQYVVCPNPACKLTTIHITYGNGSVQSSTGFVSWNGSSRQSLRLRPASYARPIPEYVPEAIREDYREACGILDLSPKAAATLARRALQGMIRDFHGISKTTLAKEIEALRDKVDPLTWLAVDAVRSVGNIGAHMEKDINTIVDVEPDEAVRLVRLIELLIKEWYVARHSRELDLAAIIALNAEKQAQRKGLASSSASAEPTELSDREVISPGV